MIGRTHLGLATLALAACGPYPSSTTAPADAEPPIAEDAGSPDDTGPTDAATDTPKAPSTESNIEVVLANRPIQAFAIGDTHVFTLESDFRTRLVAVDQKPPHAVKILVEEDILDGVKFESVGAARGRVFVVDSYGAMRSMKADGSDARDEFVEGSATRILSAPKTLWLAELPQFLGDYFTFRWFGTPSSAVSADDARIIPDNGVEDVAVDDAALLYASLGTTKALRHWAPAATAPTKGDRILATLPESPAGIALDATRAFVHLPGAKEIRSYDRSTGTASTILANASFDSQPIIRSDGKSLYALTETALRRCSLTNCAATMTAIATDLVSARALVVDATYAWIVMVPKGKTGAIVRVPK